MSVGLEFGFAIPGLFLLRFMREIYSSARVESRVYDAIYIWPVVHFATNSDHFEVYSISVSMMQMPRWIQCSSIERIVPSRAPQAFQGRPAPGLIGLKSGRGRGSTPRTTCQVGNLITRY